MFAMFKNRLVALGFSIGLIDVIAMIIFQRRAIDWVGTLADVLGVLALILMFVGFIQLVSSQHRQGALNLYTDSILMFSIAVVFGLISAVRMSEISVVLTIGSALIALALLLVGGVRDIRLAMHQKN